MKRRDANRMLELGKKLFAQIHRKKKHANHNHDVHIMAREIDEWLPQGIQSLIDGTYDPRCLKRYYFEDEVVDHVHLSDRILQHLLLKQLKPTFKHVMNSNVYHLIGPSGVKHATLRIKQVLEEEKPTYFLRVDIRSYYASIPHYKLLKDIKQHYHDPKIIAMLENIITNPIDTPRGSRNPSHGIALRAPLSQFFSALYLKPLDDALSRMDIAYVRYQDDILTLCKSKRQLNRCRKRMMEVLGERQLKLSRKKSRMGTVSDSFHFLGIHYSLTQPENYTSVKQANDDATAATQPDQYLIKLGGGVGIHCSTSTSCRFAYHTACTDATQSTREHKTNGRRSGLSCKDQTLFCAMGALVGKNSKHLGFSKFSRRVHSCVLAGRAITARRGCPL